MVCVDHAYYSAALLCCAALPAWLAPRYGACRLVAAAGAGVRAAGSGTGTLRRIPVAGARVQRRATPCLLWKDCAEYLLFCPLVFCILYETL